MEINEINQQKKDAPNATLVLILGIVSLVMCCFYGSGLIVAIVSLVLGNQALKMVKASPNEYKESSVKNLKAGRIISIITIVLGVLYLILIGILFVIYGAALFSAGFIESLR